MGYFDAEWASCVIESHIEGLFLKRLGVDTIPNKRGKQ